METGPHVPSSRPGLIPHDATRRVVYASLAGSVLVTVIKFGAAGLTGSAAMRAEGVHSLVDTLNGGLLLFGIWRGSRRPDFSHPLGYGREIYFWSFIVSLLVMGLGAAAALHEGVTELSQPRALAGFWVDYSVLALSFVSEAISGWPGFLTFRAEKGALGYLETLRASKNPAVFIVFLGDASALLGLLVAASGITAAHLFHRPEWDAWASIGVGLLLAGTSLLLARETKALLIGEAARPEVRISILKVAATDVDIRHANGVMTVQLGPSQILAALSLEFREGLDTAAIEACVSRVETAVRSVHPELTLLFIKPQTAQEWQRRSAALAMRTTTGRIPQENA